MSLENKYQELFDKVFEGSSQLTPEEIELSRTEEYQDYATNLSDILSQVRESHLSDKKAFLKRIESEDTSKQFKRKRHLTGLILAAALVVIYLLTLGKVKQDIYDQYYESYPMVALKRSATDGETGVKVAYQEYSEGDYQSASDLLQAYDDETSQFYLAISQMELNNYIKAIEILRDLKDKGNDRFPANYYLGLCYYKMDNLSESQKALNEVSPKFEYYNNLAQQILALQSE